MVTLGQKFLKGKLGDPLNAGDGGIGENLPILLHQERKMPPAEREGAPLASKARPHEKFL